MKITKGQLRRIIREEVKDRREYYVIYRQLGIEQSSGVDRSELRVKGPFSSIGEANGAINGIEREQKGLAREFKIRLNTPRGWLEVVQDQVKEVQ
jgi:hypothetical protein